MVCHGLCDEERFQKLNWNMRQCFENVVDVWWLADDGGLILLIPYILCLCTYWSRCRVRVNLLTESSERNPPEIEQIEALIAKLRLHNIYKTYRVIEVEGDEPMEETVRRFEEWSRVSMEEASRPKVLKRWLRVSELLHEYSKGSGLNVVTLPVPTAGIEYQHYMALLHLLSDQNTLPPTIMMRGNGEQTLTFYSE